MIRIKKKNFIILKLIIIILSCAGLSIGLVNIMYAIGEIFLGSTINGKLFFRLFRVTFATYLIIELLHWLKNNTEICGDKNEDNNK